MSATGGRARTLVVDDQATIAAAIGSLLALDPRIAVVGVRSGGAAALADVAELSPDVVVSDIAMPDMDGLQLAAALAGGAPAVRVLLLSTYARPHQVARALRLGVMGYQLKDAPPDRLADAVVAVAAGRRCWHADLLRLEREGAALSDRELVLLSLLRDGLSNAEIAASLSLAEGTVKNQVSIVLERLGARNRTEAVRIAEKQGAI